MSTVPHTNSSTHGTPQRTDPPPVPVLPAHVLAGMLTRTSAMFAAELERQARTPDELAVARWVSEAAINLAGAAGALERLAGAGVA